MALKRTPAADTPVYQLKVTLNRIRPAIWRRLLVPGDINLGKLHRIMQAAMGWEDYHLHLFEIGGILYMAPSPDDPFAPGEKNERRVKLADVAPPEKAKFLYKYDFGDGWEHTILVEKVLPPNPELRHAVCLAGKRSCPPEDCGGPWGYADFLEAIRDPDHEEHEGFLNWVGGEFDPEEFDLNSINDELARLR